MNQLALGLIIFLCYSPIGLILCNITVTNENYSQFSIQKSVIEEDKPEIKIEVYYESLCPDSRRFFLKQLLPTYRDIGNIMKPTLIPFGHGRILSNNKIICQHGPRECDFNRLMACVQARGSDDGQIIATIACIFENRDMAKECVSKNLPEVSYDDDIDKCRTSEESFKMMEKFEKLTGRPDYIPKLTLNNTYSEDIQNELENDLKNFICKQYTGTKPEKCSNNPAIPITDMS